MPWFYFLNDLEIRQCIIWTGMNRIDVTHWVENCKLYNLGGYVSAHFKLKFTFPECLKMLLIRMLMTKSSWNLCSWPVIQFRLPKICSWNSKFLPSYSIKYSLILLQFWFLKYIFTIEVPKNEKKSSRAYKSISHIVIPITWYACLICQEIQINKMFTYIHP